MAMPGTRRGPAATYLTAADTPREFTELFNPHHNNPEAGAGRPGDPPAIVRPTEKHTVRGGKYPANKLEGASIARFWEDPWNSFGWVSRQTFPPLVVRLRDRIPLAPGARAQIPGIDLDVNRPDGAVLYGGVGTHEHIATVPDDDMWLPDVNDAFLREWPTRGEMAQVTLSAYEFMSRRLHMDAFVNRTRGINAGDSVVALRAWLPFFLHFYMLPVFGFALDQEEALQLALIRPGVRNTQRQMGKFVACPHPLVRVHSTTGVNPDRFHVTMKLEGDYDLANMPRGMLWLFLVTPQGAAMQPHKDQFYADGASRAVRLVWDDVAIDGPPATTPAVARGLTLVIDAEKSSQSVVRPLPTASLQFVDRGEEGTFATLTLGPGDVVAITQPPAKTMAGSVGVDVLNGLLRSPLLTDVLDAVPPPLEDTSVLEDKTALEDYQHAGVTSDDYEFTRTDAKVASGDGVFTPPTCYYMPFPDVDLDVEPVQYGQLTFGARPQAEQGGRVDAVRVGLEAAQAVQVQQARRTREVEEQRVEAEHARDDARRRLEEAERARDEAQKRDQAAHDAVVEQLRDTERELAELQNQMRAREGVDAQRVKQVAEVTSEKMIEHEEAVRRTRELNDLAVRLNDALTQSRHETQTRTEELQRAREASDAAAREHERLEAQIRELDAQKEAERVRAEQERHNAQEGVGRIAMLENEVATLREENAQRVAQQPAVDPEAAARLEEARQRVRELERQRAALENELTNARREEREHALAQKRSETDAQQAVAARDAAIRDAEAASREAQRAREELAAEKARARAALDEAAKRADDADTQKHLAEMHAEEAKANVTDANRHVQELRAQLDKVSADARDGRQEERARADAEVAAKEQQVKEAVRRAQEAEADHARLTESAQKARDAHAASESARQDAEKQLRTATERLSNCDQELAAAAKRAEEAEAREAVTKAELERLKQQAATHATRAGEIGTRAADLERMQSSMNDTVMAMNDMTQEMRDLKTQLANKPAPSGSAADAGIAQQIRELKEAIDMLSEEVDTVGDRQMTEHALLLNDADTLRKQLAAHHREVTVRLDALQRQGGVSQELDAQIRALRNETGVVVQRLDEVDARLTKVADKLRTPPARKSPPPRRVASPVTRPRKPRSQSVPPGSPAEEESEVEMGEPFSPPSLKPHPRMPSPQMTPIRTTKVIELSETPESRRHIDEPEESEEEESTEESSEPTSTSSDPSRRSDTDDGGAAGPSGHPRPPREPSESPEEDEGDDDEGDPLSPATILGLRMEGRGTTRDFPTLALKLGILREHGVTEVDTEMYAEQMFGSLVANSPTVAAEVRWRYVMMRVAGYYHNWYKNVLRKTDTQADALVIRLIDALDTHQLGMFAREALRTIIALSIPRDVVRRRLAAFARATFAAGRPHNWVAAAVMMIVLAGVATSEVVNVNALVVAATQKSREAALSSTVLVAFEATRVAPAELDENWTDVQPLIETLVDMPAKRLGALELALAAVNLLAHDDTFMEWKARMEGDLIHKMVQTRATMQELRDENFPPTEYLPGAGFFAVDVQYGGDGDPSRIDTKAAVMSETYRATKDAWFGDVPKPVSERNTSQYVKDALGMTMTKSSRETYAWLVAHATELYDGVMDELFERAAYILGIACVRDDDDELFTFRQFVAIAIAGEDDVSFAEGMPDTTELVKLSADDYSDQDFRPLVEFIGYAEAYLESAAMRSHFPPGLALDVYGVLDVFETLVLAYAFYRMDRELEGEVSSAAGIQYKVLVNLVRKMRGDSGHDAIDSQAYRELEQAVVTLRGYIGGQPALAAVSGEPSPIRMAEAAFNVLERARTMRDLANITYEPESDPERLLAMRSQTTSPDPTNGSESMPMEVTPLPSDTEFVETVGTLLPPATEPQPQKGLQEDPIAFVAMSPEDEALFEQILSQLPPTQPHVEEPIPIPEPVPVHSVDGTYEKFKRIALAWDNMAEAVNRTLPAHIDARADAEAHAQQDTWPVQQDEPAATRTNYSPRVFRRVLRDYLQWAMHGDEIQLVGHTFEPRNDAPERPYMATVIPVSDRTQLRYASYGPRKTGRKVVVGPERVALIALTAAEKVAPSDSRDPELDMRARYDVFLGRLDDVEPDMALVAAEAIILRLVAGIEVITTLMRVFTAPETTADTPRITVSLLDAGHDRLMRAFDTVRMPEPRARETLLTEYVVAADRLITMIHDEMRFMVADALIGRPFGSMAEQPSQQGEVIGDDADDPSSRWRFTALPNLTGPSFMAALVESPTANTPTRMFQWGRLASHWGMGLGTMNAAFLALVTTVRTVRASLALRSAASWLIGATPIASDEWEAIPAYVRDAIFSNADKSPEQLADAMLDTFLILSLRYYLGEDLPRDLGELALPKSTYYLDSLLVRRPGLHGEESMFRAFGDLHLARADRRTRQVQFLLIDTEPIRAAAAAFERVIRAIIYRQLYVDFVASANLGTSADLATAADGMSLAEATEQGTEDGEQPEDTFARGVVTNESWIPAGWQDTTAVLNRLRPMEGDEPVVTSVRRPKPAVPPRTQPEDAAARAVLDAEDHVIKWISQFTQTRMEAIVDNAGLRQPMMRADDAERDALQNAQKVGLDVAALARAPPRTHATDDNEHILYILVKQLYQIVRNAGAPVPTTPELMRTWKELERQGGVSWRVNRQPSFFAAGVYKFVGDVVAKVPDARADAALRTFAATVIGRLALPPTGTVGIDPRAPREMMTSTGKRVVQPSLVTERAPYVRDKVLVLVAMKHVLVRIVAINAGKEVAHHAIRRLASAPVIPPATKLQVVGELTSLFAEGTPAHSVPALASMRLHDPGVAEEVLYNNAVLLTATPVATLAYLKNVDAALWAWIATNVHATASHIVTTAAFGPSPDEGVHVLARLWKESSTTRNVFMRLANDAAQQAVELFVMRMLFAFTQPPHNTVANVRAYLTDWVTDTRPERRATLASISMSNTADRAVAHTTLRYYGWPRWVHARTLRHADQGGFVLICVERMALPDDPRVESVPASMTAFMDALTQTETQYAATVVKDTETMWSSLLIGRAYGPNHVLMSVIMDVCGLLLQNDAQVGDEPTTAPTQYVARLGRRLATHVRPQGPSSGPMTEQQTAMAAWAVVAELACFYAENPDASTWPLSLSVPANVRTISHASALAAVADAASRLQSTASAYATLDANSVWQKFEARLENSVFGNARANSEFERQRANTNAFVWDMAVHLRVAGVDGFRVRLLAVVAGTDPVWGWSGRVSGTDKITAIGEVLAGNRAETLDVHRRIARDITLIMRHDVQHSKTFQMGKTDKRIAADVRGIWRLAGDRLGTAMTSGCLALRNYGAVNVDVVSWFLEGLITSLYFSDNGPARVLLRDLEWVRSVAKLAQRVVDHVAPSRPGASGEYDAAAEDVVVAALLGGPPPQTISARLPQMRAPPPVTFAPEPRRALGSVLYEGDPTPRTPQLEFVSRPKVGGLW